MALPPITSHDLEYPVHEQLHTAFTQFKTEILQYAQRRCDFYVEKAYKVPEYGESIETDQKYMDLLDKL